MTRPPASQPSIIEDLSARAYRGLAAFVVATAALLALVLL